MEDKVSQTLPVDPDTVNLAGARVKLGGKSKKALCHEEDVNDDGLSDLVCQVSTAELMIEEGESSLCSKQRIMMVILSVVTMM